MEHLEKEKQKKTLIQKLKKIALVSFTIFILFLISATVLAYIFEDDIKKYALQEINKQLKSELVINEKDITFSFIRNFPKASLNFNKLAILEENKKDALLIADNIALEFGLIKVLKGDYTVDQINLKNATIRLKVDKKGNANYFIWKDEVDSTNTDTPFKFDMNKLKLKNVDISYKNKQQNLTYASLIQNGTVSGNFSDKSTEVSISSSSFIKNLQSDSTSYIQNKQSEMDITFVYMNESEKITFNKANVSIEKMRINASGFYGLKKGDYSCKIETQNVLLSDVFTILPQNIADKLKDYQTDAILNGKASIRKNTKDKSPIITATFHVDNGKLVEKNTGAEITNVYIDGNYDLNANQQSLTVNNFKGNIIGGEFSGDLKVLGIDNLSISSTIHAKANLYELAKFLNLENIENIEGTIALNNVLKASYNQDKFQLIEFSGQTDLKDVALKLVGKKYSLANLSGDFNFNKNNSSGTFKGEYGSSDFSLNCQVQNIMERIVDNKELVVNAYLQSTNLNIDEILLLGEEQADGTVDTVFNLPQNIRSKISANVANLFFGKHHLKQFKGNIEISSEQIIAPSLSFKSNDGQYIFSGKLNPINEFKYGLTIDAVCTHINVKDFFERFDNFDQEVLQARHIKGYADAVIKMQAELTNGLTFLTPSLNVKTDFTISKGELINFELFDDMAEYIKSNKIARAFVKVDQLSTKLKHIYFDEMQNEIIIKDQKIILPNMFISSSAMDIGVYGEQDFSENIKYGFNFRLADVLTNDKTSEFGYIVDDGTGRRMYLSVVGTLDNPQFKLDPEAKKEAKKEQIQAEKDNLKSILNKEFGLFKNSAGSTTEKTVNKSKVEVDWEEENTKDNATPNPSTTQKNTEPKEEKKSPKWLDKLTGGKKEEEKKPTIQVVE